MDLDAQILEKLLGGFAVAIVSGNRNQKTSSKDADAIVSMISKLTGNT
jgi:hypothetical protein